MAAVPMTLGEVPKLGLALGGGVARGWAHIGVLRTLDRAGIRADVVCGTSVGAIIGACYLAGRLDAVELWARSINKLKMVGLLDFKMRRAGLIGGERLVRQLEQYLGDLAIEALPRCFVCVATDLVTGHEVWLSRGRLVDALRASCSMPGVLPPVAIGGRWLVDGALVNPVPISVCRAQEAQMVIGVNVNGVSLRRARSPGTPLLAAAGLDLSDAFQMAERGRHGTGGPPGGAVRPIFRRDRDTPSLFGVMVSSLGIVLDRITRSRLAGEPPDVHIAPRVAHIGLAEFDRADELIALGEQATEAALPDIREAMAALGIPGGPAAAPADPGRHGRRR